MVLEIGYVDLFSAKLTPAYDLETDMTMFAFRTDEIPCCRYAQRAMVVLVSCNTYRVSMYSPDAVNCRYVFNITPKTCDRLYNMYLEGNKNG